MAYVLSRDRRERLLLEFDRLEHRHWITLLRNHISNCRRHILRLPEPPGAPMPCPPLSRGFIQPQLIEVPARIGLEVVHDPLRACFGLYYDVNVIGTHVGGH